MVKIFYRSDAKTNWLTLKLLLAEMAKDKKRSITYSLLIPLNRTLYIVIVPLLFSFALQALLADPTDWIHPTLYLVGAAVIAGVSLICAWFGFKMLFYHEEHMRTELTKKAVRHLMQQSDQFFANRKVGALASDVINFGQMVMVFLDNLFLNASGVIMNFLVSLIVIAFIAPILLIPLGFVTAFVIVHSISSLSKRGPYRAKRKRLTAELTGTIADVLSNQQIVRFFAMGKKEVSRIGHDRDEIERIAQKEIDIIQPESMVRQAVLFSVQILTMAICIYLFTNDLISVAALVFTITYLGRLTGSMFEITPIIRTFEQSFIDAANMVEILQLSPTVSDVRRAKQLEVKSGAINFDAVSFSYEDSDADVIRQLSLSIKPGESVGLAGHSGGGKTTISKLLLRFADVQHGSITIDGQNIAEVTQDSLHESIAYVPQEAYLFHRSLRDNIAYARPDATTEEILEAARKANALEFIQDLPNGIDTIVGERGVKLSGGQRQRVAIARAILKDAPILVLDEATSALDSESERQIQAALARLMKGRTSLVIAHRLSTIARLDRIVVIDHGEIVEEGSHQELLARNGTYARLWSHQSGGFIDE